MNKPITIAKAELEQRIQQVVQESNLPAFVLVYMFGGFLSNLEQIEKQQYEEDLAIWNQNLQAEVQAKMDPNTRINGVI